MKRLFLLILVCASFGLSAQQRFPVYLDGAQFQEDEFSNRVEFYYSIPDTIMTYKPKAGQFLGEAFFMLELTAQNEKPMYIKWIVENLSKTQKIENPGMLTSQKNIVLNKGDYQCKLYVYDFADTSRNVVLSFPMKVIPFSRDSVQISNVELVQSVKTCDEAGPTRNKFFDKSGKNLLPLPNCFIPGDSANTASANFYVELYNLGKRSPQGHKMIYTLYKGDNEILTFDKLAKTSADAISDVVNVPLEFLESGVYRMVIRIAFANNNRTDTLTEFKDFYFFNPLMPPVTESLTPVEYDKSEFATLTAEQIKDEVFLMKYFCDESYITKAELLKDDLVASRKMLYDFWVAYQAQNIDRPNIRASIKENIVYANTNFGFSAIQKGWKTDRGRIYVKFGKYTRREFHQPRYLQNAYEVWTYDAYMGGLTFYFVDKESIGNYKLVHCSPAYGAEVYNEKWYQMFVTPRQQDVNSDPARKQISN